MKKQIVAILVAIAVIASLLTVSVLSEEAYKPIIQSVTVIPTEIVCGGTLNFTVIAQSNAPVQCVCYQDNTSFGYCHCGSCKNIGTDLWKCEWTRRFWLPASVTYSHIYVVNEAELRSEEWPHPISFNVTRTPGEEAYKPIIQSVTVIPTEIVCGGTVTFTVIAQSNAPVQCVCYQDNTSFGHCHCGSCKNIGTDLWKCEWTRHFWLPASVTYSHIYVVNEAELRSEEWPHPISFNVTRTPGEEAYKPIIQSVTVIPTEIVCGGTVTFTVIAQSNAPVQCVCYQDNTSFGHCHCGSCKNIGTDLWKCEWTRHFWLPASVTYSHIYVVNEAELRSEEWPHPISFNVTRTPVPTPTPPEEEGFGGYRVTPCDAIDISLENVTVTDFLNATNMSTVQVYNFKGYKGENCWMVQWSSSNRLLNVYVNVTTGEIVGIEEQTYPGPSPTQTPETNTWHSVITFSGSEDKTTPPFTIKGDEWRVNWTVNSSSKYPRLSVFVYPRGETVNYVSHWSCSKAYYSDTQYIYGGCDDYYFDVGAANLDSWKLEVEDYY